jgi:hypothetical protein
MNVVGFLEFSNRLRKPNGVPVKKDGHGSEFGNRFGVAQAKQSRSSGNDGNPAFEFKRAAHGIVV